MTLDTATTAPIAPAVALVAQLAVPLLATYASPYTDAEVRLAVADALRIVAEASRRHAEGAKLAAMVDAKSTRCAQCGVVRPVGVGHMCGNHWNLGNVGSATTTLPPGVHTTPTTSGADALAKARGSAVPPDLRVDPETVHDALMALVCEPFSQHAADRARDVAKGLRKLINEGCELVAVPQEVE